MKLKEIVECNHVKRLKCCNFVKFVVGSFDVAIDRFEVLAADYLVFASGAVVIEYAVGFELLVVVVAVAADFVAELTAEQLVEE